MWTVRRQDLGADVVVLPQRNLVVFHPDLNYSEALGALMATMPEMHLDVAQRTVEKVTPRPRAEPRRWAVIGLRMALASLATVLLVTLGGTSPASAVPEFGPHWAAAIRDLGFSCATTDDPEVRTCWNETGDMFQISGFRHANGTLYTSTGPHSTMIFVFDEETAALRYARLHPVAERHGRAVIW